MIGILQSGFSVYSVLELFAFLIAIVFCMSIHEYAHAKVAYLQGDDTAYLKGRLTLNPIAHLDPIGFLTLVLVGFGWAKPVPINPIKFKEYRKGIFLTSIAGIVTNIFAGLFSAGLYVLFFKLLGLMTEGSFLNFLVGFFENLAFYAMIININLAVFNLLPFAPLDGYNILKSICKPGNKFIEFVERYSLIISLVLLVVFYNFAIISTISSCIIEPFIRFWEFVWVF